MSAANSGDVATPETVAQLFTDFRSALQKANRTFAGIDEREFKVQVNLSKVRLDFDGDGVVSSNETLIAVFGRAFSLPPGAGTNGDIVVVFDSADAMWFNGYTHFIIGMIDVLNTFDWMPVWNQCAHVLFQNPYPVPPIARISISDGRDFAKWADLIAALHVFHLEAVNTNGLLEARKEFTAMTHCSRICWARVLAEKDNDHEWLPSPTQTGPGGSKITQAQIDGWMHILDELDAILNGDKLLPHWRIESGRGINVDHLVNNPPPLDLILMVQGSAFIPYVEKGTVSDQTLWRNLASPFGPGLLRFAVWSQ